MTKEKTTYGELVPGDLIFGATISVTRLVLSVHKSSPDSVRIEFFDLYENSRYNIYMCLRDVLYGQKVFPCGDGS